VLINLFSPLDANHLKTWTTIILPEDELLRAEEHGKFWYAIQRCQTWSSVFSDVMAWSQQAEQPAMVED
jgi:hypothetical protein